MNFSVMLMFVFFSFSIFASLEPISDSAHTLGVIDDAMDQLDALRAHHCIDADGKAIQPDRCDIEFKDVSFGYDTRTVLKHVSFRIPEKTSTAIVGPSGSGKTTVCSLIARFYDPQSGSITLGGHNLREFTCDSLLANIRTATTRLSARAAARSPAVSGSASPLPVPSSRTRRSSSWTKPPPASTPKTNI